MLRSPPKSPQPANPDPNRHALRALHTDMREADDAKIRQIVGLLEDAPENTARNAVLDPIRPRLAALRPTRSLRFTRLLFIPFGDLLVPARDWKFGQATIPRGVLKSISHTVRVGLGGDIEPIETLIAGHDTSSTEVITRAGQMLWGRAGEIMAQVPPAEDWADTGLPATAYPPLARGIATVLRNAVALQFLLRETELGVLQPNEQTISDIVANLAGEPSEGRILVFKLILGQFPHAAALLRHLADASQTSAERLLLQTATARGIDDVLADMENDRGLTNGLRDDKLSAIGIQVQRIAILLQDLGNDIDCARHRPRLRGIRQKLDGLCRGRFVDGMEAGLVSPLAAVTDRVDAAGQKQLETCARDLRSLEVAGRKFGSPAAYDALLARAGEAVRAAAESGTLSRMRAIRLVEILSGPEAAEKLLKNALPK